MRAYVWSYRVQPEMIDAFRAAYGPAGEWASLFSACPDYRGTELFADAKDPARFMTIDHFATATAHDEFLRGHRDAYDALDAKWSKATIDEAFLGEFDPVE